MEYKPKYLEELLPEYLLELQHGVGLEITGTTDAYNNSGKVRTGYSCNLIKEFNKGTLTLVGGRPSMGKTNFVINLALKASLSPSNSVALFVNELNNRDILSRILSIQAKVDLGRLQNGKIDKQELEQVKTTAKQISATDLTLGDDVCVPSPTGLFIDNSCYNSSSDIFEKCSEIKHKRGTLDLVILDDINLLIPKNDQQHLNSSMILKQLAKDLDVPIIATCHLHRDRIENPSNKNNRRPFMTDLRPPAFKKHADAVLFLYREALYDLNIKNNVLEVIVHKNATSWPTGTVRLGWDPKSLRIDEIKEERV